MNIGKTYSKFKELLTSSQQKEFVIFIFLFLIAMIFETLGIGLVIPIINILSQDNLSFLNYGFLAKFNFERFSKAEMIIISMSTLLFVYSIKTIFLTFVSLRQTRFIAEIKYKLSERLFKIYLKKPYDFHLQTNSAQLMRNVNDVDRFVQVMISLLMLITEVVVVFGVGALLLFYEPVGAISSIIVLGTAGFIFHKRVQKKVNRWGKERQIHDGSRLMHLQQGFGAIKDIKILGRENKFVNEFSIHNKASAFIQGKQLFVLSLPRYWFELLTIIGIILLVMVMVNQNKDLSLFVPTLGLFAAAAFRLMPSITRIINCNQDIRFGLPAVYTLADEINLSKKNNLIDKKNDKIIVNDIIELKKIYYTYPKSSKTILNEINLTVKCGTSIGLVGESGIGKTTLINIILGLLSPVKGQILVDGKNIHDGIRSWQNQIGYVPQNIYLNDDSIEQNIAFGIPENEIDNNAINNAINKAQLSNFINTLENGSKTKVGECGERISGGQRQRIGIARALYNNPKILVLDEATSALDNESEQLIQKTLAELQKGRTTLIIAHRLSTIREADRIVVLERGNIKEQGSHESLLEQGGLYKRLYNSSLSE